MSGGKIFCLGSYRELLTSFLNSNYAFVFFDQQKELNYEIILRHDIDFDVSLAYECALLENELGINATYFFLVKSDFYNVFSNDNFEKIKSIREMGHRISIHFDPTIYEDFHKGFSEELIFFNNLFETEVNIVSLHRPNDYFKNYNRPICGIEHTYQDKYFKHIKYFADSTGMWRFGSPLNSIEYLQGKSLHLLIHPIWWFIEGNSNLEVLKNFYKLRLNQEKLLFEKNSIPFREISHEL